jgi:hypothetical protein
MRSYRVNDASVGSLTHASVWLQRIVMIVGVRDNPQLLEFIGANPSRNTIVSPRDDLDTDGYYDAGLK